MKKILVGIAVSAVLLAGIWYAFFSGDKGSGKTLGAGVGTELVSVGRILADPKAYIGKTVTVEGTITRECPGSGCWWYVKDETGEIRMDSFGGGFALPLHQEGKRIRGTGKIVGAEEGGELMIAASGAELK